MYHSISFYAASGNSTTPIANTWDTWHLIPTSIPLINPPEVREKLVEVPGRDGMLDLTDMISGVTNFGNRTGSWEFYVCLGDYFHTYWNSTAECYTSVMNTLHGKKFRVCLVDDNEMYNYVGRFKVESVDTGEESKIKIGYSLDPYAITYPALSNPSF